MNTLSSPVFCASLFITVLPCSNKTKSLMLSRHLLNASHHFTMPTFSDFSRVNLRTMTFIFKKEKAVFAFPTSFAGKANMKHHVPVSSWTACLILIYPNPKLDPKIPFASQKVF